MADATVALKVIDALEVEAGSIAREEPVYMRPYNLGQSLDDLYRLIDTVQAEITYVMDGPHTMTAHGAALAEEIRQTVLSAWELTDAGWLAR